MPAFQFSKIGLPQLKHMDAQLFHSSSCLQMIRHENGPDIFANFSYCMLIKLGIPWCDWDIPVPWFQTLFFYLASVNKQCKYISTKIACVCVRRHVTSVLVSCCNGVDYCVTGISELRHTSPGNRWQKTGIDTASRISTERESTKGQPSPRTIKTPPPGQMAKVHRFKSHSRRWQYWMISDSTPATWLESRHNQHVPRHNASHLAQDGCHPPTQVQTLSCLQHVNGLYRTAAQCDNSSKHCFIIVVPNCFLNSFLIFNTSGPKRHTLSSLKMRTRENSCT